VVLVWRRAGELDGDPVQGRVGRYRQLQVGGRGADAVQELQICGGGA
jgi:hypothetical protein